VSYIVFETPVNEVAEVTEVVYENPPAYLSINGEFDETSHSFEYELKIEEVDGFTLAFEFTYDNPYALECCGDSCDCIETPFITRLNQNFGTLRDFISGEEWNSKIDTSFYQEYSFDLGPLVSYFAGNSTGFASAVGGRWLMVEIEVSY
jgi:hypothetical protein